MWKAPGEKGWWLRGWEGLGIWRGRCGRYRSRRESDGRGVKELIELTVFFVCKEIVKLVVDIKKDVENRLGKGWEKREDKSGWLID